MNLIQKIITTSLIVTLAFTSAPQDVSAKPKAKTIKTVKRSKKRSNKKIIYLTEKNIDKYVKDCNVQYGGYEMLKVKPKYADDAHYKIITKRGKNGRTYRFAVDKLNGVKTKCIMRK